MRVGPRPADVLALVGGLTLVVVPTYFLALRGDWLGMVPGWWPLMPGVMVGSAIVMTALVARHALDGAASRPALTSVGLLVTVIVPVTFAHLYLVAEVSTACLTAEGSGIGTLYFSYVTLTTLGYGDIQPLGLCRVPAVIEAVLGYVLLGLLVVTAHRTASSGRGG